MLTIPAPSLTESTSNETRGILQELKEKNMDKGVPIADLCYVHLKSIIKINKLEIKYVDSQ